MTTFLCRIGTRAASLLPLLLLGSGCQESRAKAVCEAAIKGSLINPETASFDELTSISRDEAARLTKTMVYRNQDLTASDRYTYASAFDALDSKVDRAIATIYGRNGKVWSMRVRADGSLGNRITSRYLCVPRQTACACFNEETVAPVIAGLQ